LHDTSFFGAQRLSIHLVSSINRSDTSLIDWSPQHGRRHRTGSRLETRQAQADEFSSTFIGLRFEARVVHCSKQVASFYSLISYHLGLTGFEIDVRAPYSGHFVQRALDLGRAACAAHPLDAQDSLQVTAESC